MEKLVTTLPLDPLFPQSTTETLGQEQLGLRNNQYEAESPSLNNILKHALYVFIAGYSLGMFFWGMGHIEVYPQLLNQNWLPIEQRKQMLSQVLMAMAGLVFVWLALAKIASWQNYKLGLNRVASILYCLSPLFFIPPLCSQVIRENHIYLLLFLTAAMAAICVHAAFVFRSEFRQGTEQDQIQPSGNNRVYLLAVVSLAIGYGLFFSAFMIAEHKAFRTFIHDLGIFDTVFYNLLNYGQPRCTFYEVPRNHLGEHFSPTLFLLAPFYWLRQDATTLLILQSMLVGLGAIPVYLLANTKLNDPRIAAVIAIAYLLFPALHGATTFDFHEITCTTVLLLLTLYFLEIKRDRLFLLFLVLSILMKEEVALSGAAIGIYMVFMKRRTRFGAAVFVTSAIYFLIVIKLIIPALGGQPLFGRYRDLIPENAQGEGEGALLTLFTNPAYAMTVILSNPGKLVYVCELCLPLLFMPLLAGRSWVIALPAFLASLLSSAWIQYSIYYQYSAHQIPFLFFLTIIGLTRVRNTYRWCLAIPLILLSGTMSCLLSPVSKEGWPTVNEHDRIVHEIINQIPKSASVSTMMQYGSHLSSRREVWLLPKTEQADYVLMDTYPGVCKVLRRAQSIDILKSLLKAGNYGVADSTDGAILLKKGLATKDNATVLKLLDETGFSTSWKWAGIPVDNGDFESLDGWINHDGGPMQRVPIPNGQYACKVVGGLKQQRPIRVYQGIDLCVRARVKATAGGEVKLVAVYCDSQGNWLRRSDILETANVTDWGWVAGRTHIQDEQIGCVNIQFVGEGLVDDVEAFDMNAKSQDTVNKDNYARILCERSVAAGNAESIDLAKLLGNGYQD